MGIEPPSQCLRNAERCAKCILGGALEGISCFFCPQYLGFSLSSPAALSASICCGSLNCIIGASLAWQGFDPCDPWCFTQEQRDEQTLHELIRRKSELKNQNIHIAHSIQPEERMFTTTPVATNIELIETQKAEINPDQKSNK